MSILVSTCISYHLTVSIVLASNSTSSDDTDATMKALLTVGILVACLVIALVVAKIVDSCYDHHIAVNDNASDISEDTRKLVRLRLAVNALSRIRKNTNDSKAMSPRENQRRIIRIWSARAKESRRIADQRRAEITAAKQGNKSIIKVEEAMAESKITTATVAAAFLTVSETPSKNRATMLTPQSARAGKPSPIMASRSVSVSPHKPEAKRKMPETPGLSPRSISKSSPATLQVPQEILPGDVEKKVVSGVDTDNKMAGAVTSTKKVHSGNQTVEGFSRGVLDSCGDNLTIELGGEDPETYRSAVDLGQDSVRSEAALDLVALSCRSDIKAFPGCLLQGLDASTRAGVVEQETSMSEALETGSVKPDPSRVTVSQIQTSTATNLSQDYVVDTSNTHSSVTEAEEEDEVMLQPSQKSLAHPSTPDTTDTAGMNMNSTTTTIKDSNNEPGNYPEDSSQENPTSPKSREIFTITLPTEPPNPDTCKLSQQTGDSENKRGRSVDRALSFPKRKLRGKARPLSFSVKDMTAFRKVPPQLAESVRLYTGVRGVFNLRKGPQGSKKTMAGRRAHGSDSHPCSVALGKSGEGEKRNDTGTIEEVQNHSDKF